MPNLITRTKSGDVIATVKSTVITVQAGTTTHMLHLHKDNLWHWCVSDPVSGGRVLAVVGQYKGIRTSSKGYSLREIKNLALAQVQALIERIGSDKFNSVVGNKLG